MKKTTVIASILLILAIFIGLERFDSASRNEPRPAPTTRNDPIDTLREILTPNDELTGQVAPSILVPTTELTRATDRPDRFVNPSSEKSPGSMSSRGDIGIRFVQGRVILGTASPDPESVARLQKAVQEVTSNMTPSIVIVDADALSTSSTPFLAYADPRFDLTKAVGEAYRALSAVKESPRTPGTDQ